VQMRIRHVPRTVQSACDPGLAKLGLSLGVDLGIDPDPIWSYGHVGLHMYPSALCLARYLLSAQGCQLAQNKRILELGCGIGLLGPVACLAGAAHVMLTDFDPVVLSLCEHNQKLNADIAALANSSSDKTSIADVRRLDWRTTACSPLSVDRVPSQYDPRSGTRSPPQDVPLTGWDVILASDVLYDEGLSSALKNMLTVLMDRNPQVVILLAVQYREDNPLDIRSSVVESWLEGISSIPPPDKKKSCTVNDSPDIDLTRGSRRLSRSRSPTNRKTQSAKPAFEAKLVAGPINPEELGKKQIDTGGAGGLLHVSEVCGDRVVDDAAGPCRQAPLELWQLKRSIRIIQ